MCKLKPTIPRLIIAGDGFDVSSASLVDDCWGESDGFSWEYWTWWWIRCWWTCVDWLYISKILFIRNVLQISNQSYLFRVEVKNYYYHLNINVAFYRWGQERKRKTKLDLMNNLKIRRRNVFSSSSSSNEWLRHLKQSLTTCFSPSSITANFIIEKDFCPLYFTALRSSEQYHRTIITSGSLYDQ